MKGKYALQFDQRRPDDNNDDGGGTSNFSGISGSGSGIQRGWRAKTSEPIRRGLVALHEVISD